MTLRVGVAGAGVMGRRHAQNVASLWPRARLVAIADVNTEAAQLVARDLECDWHADAYELISRSDLDAVLVVTGADTHASLTIAASEHGLEVFTEKPLALTLEDAEAAANAAAKNGVRLQVGFMRRYDPAYREAHEAIERGDVGKPLIFSAISRDARPPALSQFSPPANGGLFIDSGIHDLDLARWLMRDEIESICAAGAAVASHRPAGDEPIDAATVILRFQRGGFGTIQLYRNARYGYDIRTEVLGTEGAVTVGDHRGNGMQLLRPEGITHSMPDHWLARFAEAYRLEIADWVERMSGDGPPAVTGEDGVCSVALALAAERSRQTGQTVTV